MSFPNLPPNPCLIAILFIVKNRTGVQCVFHHPEIPGQDKPHIRLDYENSSKEEPSISSEDGGYSSLEDETRGDGKLGRSKGNINDPDIDESRSASPEKNDGHNWRRPDILRDGLFALPHGIQHFLCPPATAHKKRFEMSIDGRVFLGWPIFSREDGSWRRKKKLRLENVVVDDDAGGSNTNRTAMQLDADLGDTTGNDTGNEDEEAIEQSLSADTDSISDPVDRYQRRQDKATENPQELLHMFHVVFVMNPPPLEYQVRVDEMYTHIVKKFSRALKWEQARSDMVLKEVKKLRDLQAKHESPSTAFKHSPLARAIATLYTHVSTSRIAHITLPPSLNFSLQIPIPTSISHLPTLTEPALPGLWLTTATSIQPSSTQIANPALASHFTILLLSDLSTVLSDIAAIPSPLTTPLTTFLRLTTPTKSFLQLSQASGLALADIQFLASHLIYWRRARAIPPLHHRDTYIVSPNADMRKLKTASIQYARLFPALPSLPKVLNLLSGVPKPFAGFIPSKDHKEAYLQILAWLLRGGWVTQLRTFAWVRIPVRIQVAVAKELEAETEDAAHTKEDKEDADPSPNFVKHHPNLASSFSNRTANTNSEHNLTATSTPSHNPVIATIPHLPSPSSSLSSTHTAIPISRPIDKTPSTSPYRPYILPQPTKASGLASRHLAAISRELSSQSAETGEESFNVHSCQTKGKNKDDVRSKIVSVERRNGKEAEERSRSEKPQAAYSEELARGKNATVKGKGGEGRIGAKDMKEAWEICLKYFNGEHALEKVAGREGWKRKRVEGLRQRWRELGVLVECRGW